MPNEAQVGVVGAGIDGLATARALARRGLRVAVYEQFRVGHERGSSHGRSRIYRLSYPEVRWIRLAREAIGGWRELERERGEQLLERTGLLEIVRNPGEGSQRAFDEAAVAYELLGPDEVAARFALSIPGGGHAVYQPDAGVVFADRALDAFRASAVASGARIVEQTRIESLDAVDADTVVVTAGSWAKGLLAHAGIDLPVVATRETVGYFRNRTSRPAPAVVDFKPGTTAHGVYSLYDPVHGLKMGVHKSGPPTDPDDDGSPDEQRIAEMREAVERYFPRADPEPVEVETCLYTIAQPDDNRFFIERHGRIVVGSACSGHGFKFAPAVGRRLADLAEEALAAADM